MSRNKVMVQYSIEFSLLGQYRYQRMPNYSGTALLIRKFAPFVDRKDILKHRLIAGADVDEIPPAFSQSHMVWPRVTVEGFEVVAVILPETHAADPILATRAKRKMIATRALKFEVKAQP